MQLSKKYTTVTPLSKTLALILFVILPFIGFYLGSSYQNNTNQYTPTYPQAHTVSITPTPDLTQTQDPNIYACNKDSDCTTVTTNGCSCGSIYAINKQYTSFWKSQYYPTPPTCTMSMCISPRVQCISNKCQLVQK